MSFVRDNKVIKKITSFDGCIISYQHFKKKRFKSVNKKEQPTLVLLHGVGSNCTVWRNELRFFLQQGYSILNIDLRGHGQSGTPKEFERYQLPHFSKDLYKVLDKEKIKNFVFVGHSLGGAVALNYIMNYKKRYPASIVFIDSASAYPFNHNRLLNLSPYLTNLLRFISNHQITKKEHFYHLGDVDLSAEGLKSNLKLVSHLIHLTPLRSVVRTLDNVEKFVFKNKKEINSTLKNLNIPILVIAGKEDKIVPIKYSKQIKRITKNSELKIIQKADHNILIEKPEEVSLTIHEFITKKLI